jgi:pSer/pThr/pTyr-binding forkhead associated (FHA) protein
LSPSPLGKLVETISDLGIASKAALTPYVSAMEASGNENPHELLDGLLEGSVISPTQHRVLKGFVPALDSRETPNTGLPTLRSEGPGGSADDPTADWVSRSAEPPGISNDPFVGKTFGSFLALRKLGEGGMARVYEAARKDDPERKPAAAVKVFLAATDPASLVRFRREGEIMASLRHRNIVAVFEAGEENSVHYLAMEIVEGPTLQDVIERRRRLPWESATKVVMQIASALATAHVMGIVHRDVKPHNVLVDRDATIKLFDFGLAKSAEEGMVSKAGQILGSPAYIAPEQWGDHEVDHKADLFSLGVVYYLLLTGVTPFRGRTPAEYASRIQAGQYAPLEGFSVDVPPPVRHVITQLLEIDRRYRTPSANSLLQDLDRILRNEQPYVPRLEGSQTGAAHALVGRNKFVVGTGPDVDLWLDAAGVEEQHATLERTSAGLLLTGKTPKGSRVNDQRVSEVVLKDGDRVRFGESEPFIYREGNLSGTGLGELAVSGEYEVGDQDPDGTVEPPREVPGLLVAALQDAGHPLTLLCCFETLDMGTAEVMLDNSKWRLEQAGIAPEVAQRARDRALYLWRQRAGWIADRLFHATHENLGNDPEAWLAWWFEVRQRYPLQIRPLGNRVRGQLLIPQEDGADRVVQLHDGDEWTVGRSLEADVEITDLSVSRRHAKIYRLITRFAFQDLGSRLGIRQSGERKQVGLLRHGDLLELGRMGIQYQELPEPATEPPAPSISVDRATFSALVEMRSPTTVMTLINLLNTQALVSVCLQAASSLGLSQPLDSTMEPFLEAHRVLALESLPPITRANFGSDVAGWQQWFSEQGDALPPQVEPWKL